MIKPLKPQGLAVIFSHIPGDVKYNCEPLCLKHKGTPFLKF